MRIAIAGAGIAGLASAIALARAGFAVELFERAPELLEIGAGIQLSPNAMRVLDRLGVAADLAGDIVEPAAIELCDGSSGAPLARIPLGDVARQRYGAPYALIHRADLQTALHAAARRHANIAVQMHADVHEVRATDRGVVFTAAGQNRLADVLVAADGVSSRIRTSHFGHGESRPAGRSAWRTTLPVAAAPFFARQNVVGVWFAPDAHLVHYRVGGDRLNVVMIGPSGPSPPVRQFGAWLHGELSAITEWAEWPVRTVDPAPSWTKGRVALIGDAAHAMLPTVAQGGAQAIEDAWVLAARLSADAKQPSIALAAWERERRGRIKRVVGMSQRNLRIYEATGLFRLFRNIALDVLPTNIHLKQLDWLLDWRPV